MRAKGLLGVYLQFGCGLHAPQGWENFDVSPALWVRKIPLVGRRIANTPFPENVRLGDIRKGLPVNDGSADAIYCSHVLEHLSLEDLRKALRNTLKALKAGGVFRMVLPDLKAYAAEYLASDQPDAAMVFLEMTQLGRPWRPKGLTGWIREVVGSSLHLWMWDYESLALELKAAGFGKIRRAVCGDNDDPVWRTVEQPERWTDQLGIECVKPTAA